MIMLFLPSLLLSLVLVNLHLCANNSVRTKRDYPWPTETEENSPATRRRIIEETGNTSYASQTGTSSVETTPHTAPSTSPQDATTTNQETLAASLNAHLTKLAIEPVSLDFEGEYIENFHNELASHTEAADITLSLLSKEPAKHIKFTIAPLRAMTGLHALTLTGHEDKQQTAEEFFSFVENCSTTLGQIKSVEELIIALHLYTKEDRTWFTKRATWAPSSVAPGESSIARFKARFSEQYTEIRDFFDTHYESDNSTKDPYACWLATALTVLLGIFPNLKKLAFETFDLRGDIVTSALYANIRGAQGHYLTHINLSHSIWENSSLEAVQDVITTFLKLVLTVWRSSLKFLNLTRSDLVENLDQSILENIDTHQQHSQSSTVLETLAIGTWSRQEVSHTDGCPQTPEDCGCTGLPPLPLDPQATDPDHPALCWLDFLSRYTPNLKKLAMTHYPWHDAQCDMTLGTFTKLRKLENLYITGHHFSKSCRRTLTRTLAAQLPKLRTFNDISEPICID